MAVLSQEVPCVRGLTLDAEIVTVREYANEVVAIVTATAHGQQLRSWFRQAVTEVQPRHFNWLHTSGRPHERRRQARLLVVISLAGAQGPEGAVTGFLTGTMRKVQQRQAANAARPKPRPEQTTRPSRQAASPLYRYTPRRQLALR